MVGKQLPPDSVWRFWENKTRMRILKDSEMRSDKVAKEREQMLKNLEDDGKKAKTVKRKKKLQEDCVKMMTKLVEDWESDKIKEEEEVFKRLEDAEKKKKICAAVVVKMTPTDDSQVQLTTCSSSRPETATEDRMTDYNVTSFKKMTPPCRQTPTEFKLMQKMTAPPRTHQTEADCSSAKTRRVKDIAARFNTGQPNHLPSAKLSGQQSKNVITKPSKVLCS